MDSVEQRFSPETLARLSQSFEHWSPQAILVWALETYWPVIAMSSSFQTTSVVLLHMIAQEAPDLPILFLDTGYHFPETLEFRQRLADDWNLTVVDLAPSMGHAGFKAQYGDDLYTRDPDRCCQINKVDPLQAALTGLHAWITGIRRDQTRYRAQANILELQPAGLVKVNPLLNWSKRDVWQYIHDHNLPAHPLFHQGYPSVGCQPCTRAVAPGEDDRAGRWAGMGKTECGLHTTPIVGKPGAA